MVDTAYFLSEQGLSCEELLNVNFNTDAKSNKKRAMCRDGLILRSYAEDVKDITSMIVKNSRDPIGELGPETALGLLHEMYYEIIQSGRKFKKDLGINKTFAQATALETIVGAEITCPECGGEMRGEHLQYRGDLYCVDCDVDLDVKTSRTGSSSATAHCKKYNSDNAKDRKKAGRTRYATYMRDVGKGFFQVWVIDCMTERETAVSGDIPWDMYHHVAEVAVRIVRPFANRIKELARHCG